MNAPKLPSFFKPTRHRQFDFKTRYYDAEKEARTERRNLLQNQLSGLRNNSNWSTGKRSKELRSSNKRLLFIVLILFILSALFLTF